MALEYPIPRANAAPLKPDGQFRTEWYNFLRTLASTATSAGLQAELEALAERVAELEAHSATSAVIAGLYSIATYGSLAAGIVQVQLQGDRNNLGPTWFYGTDTSSHNGWTRLFDAFAAGDGIEITDSGYRVLGVVETVADIPATPGTTGDAWRVLAVEEAGLYAWDGAAWTLDPAATGLVGIKATTPPSSGGVPYFIPDGETYTVPIYTQALFTLPIELGDGASLVVDGALVEVT